MASVMAARMRTCEELRGPIRGAEGLAERARSYKGTKTCGGMGQ